MISNNKRISGLPELLAPAGTPEALDAAIEAGADAVYFGYTAFSCRMRAGNFGDSELGEAIAKCRAYGVKSYITVNTRLRGGELDEAVELADKLYELGADAMIVADTAFAAAVREKHPDFEIHASTQCSGATATDAKVLASLGFSRMVCPRELSAAQIKKLAGESPIGIEMFIHGAHCASFSGQCLASFAMGGRSGNRGECAQPCRLPYSGCGDLYPLSIKDMCLAGHITEIIGLGVESLKIEGRQKSADYVYGVTSVYRRLLDERRNATKTEAAQLAALFSRSGFTDGYFKGKLGNMTGIRSEADAALSRAAEKQFTSLTRRIPLDMSFTAKSGEKAKLTVSARGFDAAAEGVVPGIALNRPLDKASAEKNLTKLGGTPYKLGEIRCEIDEGLFMTPAEINSLRRDALTALDRAMMPKREARKTEACPRNKSDNIGKRDGMPSITNESLMSDNIGKHGEKPRMTNESLMSDSIGKHGGKPRMTAEFLTADSIPTSAREFFDEIYVPYEEYTKDSGYGINLPPIMTDEASFPREAVRNAGAVLAHSFAELALSLDEGARVTSSVRMNVFSPRAKEELMKLGCTTVIASPELPLGAVRASGGCGVVAYGRLPLMHLMRCPQSGGKCRGEGGYTGKMKPGGGLCLSCLTDRMGASFPLVGMADCVNVLYNSVPIYMADRQSELERANCEAWHFIFSTETKEEVERIIEAYRKALPPRDGEKIRRLR